MTSIRREIRRITNEGPRPFGCPVTVVAVRELTPGFSRVTVEGAGLSDYREPRPADAFKLLLPPDGAGAVDFPERGADGLPYWPAGTQRPALRAFTYAGSTPPGHASTSTSRCMPTDWRSPDSRAFARAR